MAAALPALMIAGTALGAVGAIRSGQANAAAADYNAGIARQNAQIAQAQGEAASEAQQRDTAQKMGAALAAYGASGVQTGTGSPEDVLVSSARLATLNNLTLRYNYQLKGMGYQNEAALDESESDAASTNGFLSGFGQLLSGGAKAYGMMVPGADDYAYAPARSRVR
jgi:hypothetical protein